MAWLRPGDKPLSEPMMDYLLTDIWVTRTQWVKLEVVPQIDNIGIFPYVIEHSITWLNYVSSFSKLHFDMFWILIWFTLMFLPQDPIDCEVLVVYSVDCHQNRWKNIDRHVGRTNPFGIIRPHWVNPLDSSEVGGHFSIDMPSYWYRESCFGDDLMVTLSPLWYLIYY